MTDKQQELHAQIRRSVEQQYPHKDIYIVPEPYSRKVKELNAIKWDLEDVHQGLSELLRLKEQDLGNEIMHTSLWKAAIITYARCFNGSEDGGKSKLQPKDCFKRDLDFADIHEFLMDVRNGFVAHRGNGFEEIVFFMLADKIQPKPVEYITKSIRQGTALPPQLPELLQLINHLLLYINKKIDEQLRKLENQIEKNAYGEVRFAAGFLWVKRFKRPDSL